MSKATVLDININISIAIHDILNMNLDGCITGSCVLPNNFNDWETVPDIDFFAYSEGSWIAAVCTMLSKERYTAATKKDAWKFERLSQGRNGFGRNKNITQTIYIKDKITGIYINLSYKPGTSNITDVLSRFDTVAIMLGICCRTKKKCDLRFAFSDIETPFTLDFSGHANPIRLWYMAEAWDETTWSRELCRIQKYAGRGFAMNQMAYDLIGVARRVLDKGDVVGTEKSKARYLGLLMSCYRPVVWLENFLNNQGNAISISIHNEIITLIKDLPEDIQDQITSDLSIDLVPEGDKIFAEEEEEEVEEQDR